jgi:hypothetical protein
MSVECDRFDVSALEQIERGEPLGEHFRDCAPCRMAAAAYETIRGKLAGIEPEGSPAPDWEAKVWAGIRRNEASRRRARWVPALGLSAAAAAVALVAWPGRGNQPRLDVAVEAHGGEAVRGASTRPGDLLRVRGTTGGAKHADLRIYRDGALVFRCTETTPCVTRDQAISAQLPLTSLGRYETVLLIAEQPFGPSEVETAMSADLEAALAGGAKLVTSESIDVF